MKTLCKNCQAINPAQAPKCHNCGQGIAKGPLDAAACSGFRVTLEAVGLTKASAMAHAVRVLGLMMEEAHTKGHSCGTINGNASAKLDVIP